jgi:inositol 2-dehydrogenase
MPVSRLNVGLIGLGRLGSVYAHNLAARIADTRLVAVADTATGLAENIAAQYDVPRSYEDPLDLLDDRHVDAVVIVTPTQTHPSLAIASLERGKPTFCEKPPALLLEEALAMKSCAERTGIPLHIGFMRRFDPGYVAAKRRLEAGAIGNAVVFKATSRDPYPPAVEYADPKSSGGLLLDMGIHDFDLARWFMGPVKSLHAIGGTLVYPQLGAVGDIDNAVVTLQFASDRLGVVDLSRNGIYGYDITTELLGTRGTVRIGYLRETPVVLLDASGVWHDTVPYFMQRFEKAYVAQLEDFARAVSAGRPVSVDIDDGIEALRIAIAARESYRTGRSIELSPEAHFTST